MPRTHALALCCLMACSRPDAEGPTMPPDGGSTAAPSTSGSSTMADPTAADSTTDGPSPSDVGTQPEGCLALLGGTLAGGDRLDLEIEEGLIVDAGVFDEAHPARACAEVIDLRGRFLAPAFIDSHVHLAYLPVAEAMASRGVAAAVDLAAPLEFLDMLPQRPQVIAAGPMITAVDGYPTQSWGANGYGIECPDAQAAADAVDLVHERGAGVVKIPLGAGPDLPADALAATVAQARLHGLRVASHALGDDSAALAAQIGADLLAHTPTEPLSPDTAQAWSGRAVVTTLAAFGASATTLSNLAGLQQAGAIVLYGTDLGNSQDAGIQADEISAMQAAGLDGAEILAAGTSAPAEYWGLTQLGSLEVGKAASVLVLEQDPVTQPLTLSEPAMVVLNGVRVDR